MTSKEALITVKEISETARSLRGPKPVRAQALAKLLDMLGDYAERSGWRTEGTKIRRIARDIYDISSYEDQEEGALEHDDTRQLWRMAGRIADRKLET